MVVQWSKPNQMRTVFVSQVQRFLEKIQRDTQMTGCDQESKDRPASPEEGTGEKRRRKEMRGAEEGNKEAVKEESLNSMGTLDAETRECTQHITSFSSASETVDSECLEKKEPIRQLKCLEISDFLLSDTPKGNNGKNIICHD